MSTKYMSFEQRTRENKHQKGNNIVSLDQMEGYAFRYEVENLEKEEHLTIKIGSKSFDLVMIKEQGINKAKLTSEDCKDNANNSVEVSYYNDAQYFYVDDIEYVIKLIPHKDSISGYHIVISEARLEDNEGVVEA